MHLETPGQMKPQFLTFLQIIFSNFDLQPKYHPLAGLHVCYARVRQAACLVPGTKDQGVLVCFSLFKDTSRAGTRQLVPTPHRTWCQVPASSGNASFGILSEPCTAYQLSLKFM